MAEPTENKEKMAAATQESATTMTNKNDDQQLDAAALAKKKKKEKEKEKEKAKKEKEKEKKAKEGEKDGQKKKKTTTSDLIKEAMKIRQQEEEKARAKEEEEERKRQELEEQRQKKIQEEKERKERKKQKEKEKVEKLKKEGKYMNAEQRQKLLRQREMVEMMKQQGLLVIGEKEGAATTGKPGKLAKKKEKTTSTNEESKENTPDVENADLTHGDEVKTPFDEKIADSWEHIELEDKASLASKQKSVDESSEGSSTSEVLVDINNTPATGSTGLTVAPTVADVKPSSTSPENDGEVAHHNNNYQHPHHKPPPREKEPVPDRIKRRNDERSLMKDPKVLRSPVICVLGHVDTGKTKILDKIRQTHVQDGEAGGITQQIGATFVPAASIKEQGKMVKDFDPDKLNLPGFLIIDTPGHESFSNLRIRGSSLCDIAIVVVDIMHGLEPQTIESLNILKKRKTPFIVALNKIDRLYEWKMNPKKDVRQVLKSQQPNAQLEFQDRFNEIQVQFAEQGLNVALFWDNKDYSEYVSMIPTSAHSGDGMGNLMCGVAQICQGQYRDRLTYTENLQCSVLEVKSLPGLGTTIDVILLNGRLHVGDTVVVAGMEGPIVTQIRELLMPQPLREIRVKTPYEHFKELRGAQGIKILAKDMDKALAGLPLLVAEHDDEIDYFKAEISHLFEQTLHAIKLSDKGVYVQASTLGSLEALLDFLKSQKIPYSGINIGPVHKKDVMRCSAMLEHDSQWAVILAFDVKVERDAELMADELGVKIFHADIIYHLQDAFVKYREELRQKKRQENSHLAIFPCKLRILPQHVFKTRDPIVVGVSVEDGVLKVGTPLAVPSKENLLIGSVSSIEINQKQVESARKGQEVAIKIENTTGEAPKMYGRHFDYQDLLVSKITRETIDVCKQYFREDLQKNDWQLIVELKKTFGIL